MRVGGVNYTCHLCIIMKKSSRVYTLKAVSSAGDLWPFVQEIPHKTLEK